jgi:hypothetical protein
MGEHRTVFNRPFPDIRTMSQRTAPEPREHTHKVSPAGPQRHKKQTLIMEAPTTPQINHLRPDTQGVCKTATSIRFPHTERKAPKTNRVSSAGKAELEPVPAESDKSV